MARTLLVLGTLLAVMLGWAYRVAHPPVEAPGAGEVTLWEIPPRDIVRVTGHTPRGTTTLTPEWPARGDTPAVWVQVQPAPSKGELAGRTPPAPPANTFRGNNQAVSALLALASPRASRRIGALRDLDPAEFGFPGDSGYVLVERAEPGTPIRLELGDLFVGKSQRYVHTPAEGLVFLVPEAAFRPFVLPAQRLMERRLLPFPPGEAARVDLRQGSRSASLWRLPGAEGEAPRWAARPDAADGEESARAFIEALPRVTVAEYLPPEQPLPPGTDVLEVRLFREAGTGAGTAPDAWVRFREAQGRTAAAVSSFTERPVQVPAPLLKALLARTTEVLNP